MAAQPTPVFALFDVLKYADVTKGNHGIVVGEIDAVLGSYNLMNPGPWPGWFIVPFAEAHARFTKTGLVY